MSNTLDPYLPSMTEEEKQKIIAGNFSNLNQKQGMSGPNLLVNKSSTVQQVTSSTTYVNVAAFNSGITTSGGLLQVSASIFYRIASSNVAGLALFIDGSQVCQVAGLQVGSLNMVYNGKLTPGNHKIELKVKVDGGTLTTNNAFSGDTSYLFITEFL